MSSNQLSLFSDDAPEQTNGATLSPTKEEKKELAPEKKVTHKVSKVTHPELQKIETELELKESLTDEDRELFLAKIKEVALTCTSCALSEKRTQVVFSDGNHTAPIMIVGEGPGENEDKTGIPFVGKAGQLLTKILESVQISREHDIYIANVVKCRPPENRVPLNEEVEACSFYLKKQIELSKASIILLTGATAMKAILNQTAPISKVRGEWIQWKGRWVMPIFHPSYLLRNSSREVGAPKWLMWQDIKKVKAKLNELRGNN